MNERTLHENWQSFGDQNNLKFDFEDKSYLSGIISKIQLKNKNQTIVLSRIAKTGTVYKTDWSKVFFEPKEIHGYKIKVKNSNFNWFTKVSNVEKDFRKILKTMKASELILSETESFIKFNRVLFTREEIGEAIEMKKKINRLLIYLKTK